ncbi:MAG: type I methionyl aminopeptidase [Clostridia bacterium]|nr:type I methionyl aminopeptidase [Clostridia bacterium]
MIIIKSDSDIRCMRRAGAITAAALAAAGAAIKPGMSTKELDCVVEDAIRSKGAIPSFKGYGGFPGSACISINNVVIHGIPSKDIIIKEGDIVSVDVGAFIDGFHGDSAFTFPVGDIADNAKLLLKTTNEALYKAHDIMKAGVRLGDIGNAVQSHCEAQGFSVVRDFVGHGIGRDLHEDPSVQNYGKAGHGMRLPKGSTVAVEPMINEGTYKVFIDSKDGWTVTTADGKLSAHFEHTFYIDDGCAHILTVQD